MKLKPSFAALALLPATIISICAQAATPVDLQPFLEYPPIQTHVGQTAGTGGTGHAVLVMDLDPSFSGVRLPSIVVSEYRGSASSVVAFDGASGKPLRGWGPGQVQPLSANNGPAYLSGATEPYPRVMAAFYLKPALVVAESGSIMGAFSLANYHTSPMAMAGYIPGYRHDATAAHYGGEDGRVHKVPTFTLAEAPGWPKTLNGAQRVSTPALLDVNADQVPEVFSTSGASSAGFEVRAHDGATGNLLWTQVLSNGFPENYLVVGQILADSAPELALVHRVGGNPSTLHVAVLDAMSGSLDATFALPGFVPYGTAPALADLNDDGLDDVIVSTESWLSAVGGSGFEQLAGFPVNLGDVWLGDSAPIVGDIGGSAGVEIVLTTQVPGSFSSRVHIINQNGSYMLPQQPMVLGGGQTNAIHDLDGDGHNELVIAARGAPFVGLQDSVWVLDFSRNETTPVVHGDIPWGQYRQNAERCGCSKLVTSPVIAK